MAKKIIKKAIKKAVKKGKTATKVVIKKAAKRIVKKDAAPDATEMVKFVLRLEPKTHQQIKKSAKLNNTSMNREIANILKAPAGLDRVLSKLDEILARLPAKKG